MNSTQFKKIVQNINGINHSKRIKIRYRRTDQKGFSLYLDLWKDGKRQYDFLKLYLIGNPTSYHKDKENLRLACAIRDKKEIELLEKETGFNLTSQKSKANFLDYFSKIVTKKNHHNWTSCKKHLIDFAGRNFTFKQIDQKFCNDFKDYLLSNFHQNTSQSYFAKFKASLNTAVKEKIILENPAQFVTIKKIDTSREFLTVDELEKASKTPAADIEVKNAFIFSCYTGLRISDIRSLTFDKINGNYLDFTQQKTNGYERIKLHQTVLDIVEKQKKAREKSENDFIFLLPIDPGTINKVIRNWMKSVGVKKDITFHCARHTFATMCLTYDVDIYTVSKLLGHQDLKSTQIYAKLIDKKKDEAIERLPYL
ncbi:MAG: tyrosine-type recombinase/integrase [Candidatus Thorarchaeota archaeon]